MKNAWRGSAWNVLWQSGGDVCVFELKSNIRLDSAPILEIAMCCRDSLQSWTELARKMIRNGYVSDTDWECQQKITFTWVIFGFISIVSRWDIFWTNNAFMTKRKETTTTIKLLSQKHGQWVNSISVCQYFCFRLFHDDQ